MNELEQLIAEYDEELEFKFVRNMPDKLPALIVNRTVYVNADLPYNRTLAYVAEEIGHYHTAHGDISDYSKNMKREQLGRRWSYKKLMPSQKISDFVDGKDIVMAHDLAEEFGVPEDIVEEAVEMYRVKGEI